MCVSDVKIPTFARNKPWNCTMFARMFHAELNIEQTEQLYK